MALENRQESSNDFKELGELSNLIKGNLDELSHSTWDIICGYLNDLGEWSIDQKHALALTSWIQMFENNQYKLKKILWDEDYNVYKKLDDSWRWEILCDLFKEDKKNVIRVCNKINDNYKRNKKLQKKEKNISIDN